MPEKHSDGSKTKSERLQDCCLCKGWAHGALPKPNEDSSEVVPQLVAAAV
jgi:hypothetical protein